MKKLNSSMGALFLALVMTGTVDTADARLPVPAETPESQAKAAENAAKVAAAAKREAEELARYQDKAVTNHRQRQARDRPAGSSRAGDPAPQAAEQPGAGQPPQAAQQPGAGQPAQAVDQPPAAK